MMLTSETIYNADNYQCLHDIMQALLKPDGTMDPLTNKYKEIGFFRHSVVNYDG